MEYTKQQAEPQAGAPAGHAAANFPEKPRRVRRVGTVSLGIALIFVGALMAAAAFLPAVNVLEVLKFAPLILVVLGIEVLAYSARPDVQLKYDFLSMFLCFVLVVAAAGGSLLSWLAAGWGPGHARAEQRLSAQLEQQSYDALHTDDQIRDVTVQVQLQRAVSGEDWQTVALTDLDTAGAYVTLKNGFADTRTFAESCRRIIDEAEQAGLPFDRYTFVTDGQENLSRRYSLRVEGEWAIHRTAQELAPDVEAQIWYDGTLFDSEQELNDYLSQFDGEPGQVLPATAESSDTASAAASDAPESEESTVSTDAPDLGGSAVPDEVSVAEEITG